MKTQIFRFVHATMICMFIMLMVLSCKKDDDKPALQLPVLTTLPVSNILHNTASSGGNITSDGGDAVTARGVCWNTTQSPTIAGNKTSDGMGTGNFTSDITGLSPGTQYYVRAYATNSFGTAYGQEVNFTTTDANLLNSLFSYWKLDEITGTIAGDATGTWDLSFQGNPIWTTSGKINSAVDFGTTTATYLERSNINSGNKNTYTLAAWINLEDGSADGKNIMGMNSGSIAMNAGAAEVKMILVGDNRLAALYHTVDGSTPPMQRIGGTIIALNTWYFVAAVIDNGNLDLYVNGAVDNANPITGSISSNLNFTNGRITIGNARLWNGDYLAHRWFRGKIDEAAIWDRALTAVEISILYNNGNGIQYPF